MFSLKAAIIFIRACRCIFFFFFLLFFFQGEDGIRDLVRSRGLGDVYKRQGVRSARVVPLPTGTAQWWLRVARADAEMQTRLKSLPPERLGSGFRPCAVDLSLIHICRCRRAI